MATFVAIPAHLMIKNEYFTLIGIDYLSQPRNPQSKGFGGFVTIHHGPNRLSQSHYPPPQLGAIFSSTQFPPDSSGLKKSPAALSMAFLSHPLASSAASSGDSRTISSCVVMIICTFS